MTVTKTRGVVVIEVRGVTKTYGKRANRFTALDDVGFTIPDGVSVAIVGKSGSGKSTLMHVMSGLDKPERGEILVDGENILSMNQKQIDKFRSEKIGFIFQSFFVQANESCVDNVGLPLEIALVPRRKRREMIDSALERVELTDKAVEKARNLSGGQKQRLAIARAIVNSPSIIFADEPTGNLDTATGDTIEELLFSFNKQQGTTLIIVTHDSDLAARCDMRINIRDGKVVSIEGETKGNAS